MVGTFESLLKELVEKTPGAEAALIMDAAGIALATFASRAAKFDIATIGIEYTVVVSAAKQASAMLEAGEAREVAVTTAGLVTLLRTVGTDYFLALAMTPRGNLGKGRFLMRTLEPKLLALL